MACELYFNKAVRENIMIRQLFTYLHASNLIAKHIPQAGTYICVYYYYYFLKRADEKKATPLRLSDSLCLNFERLDYEAVGAVPHIHTYTYDFPLLSLRCFSSTVKPSYFSRTYISVAFPIFIHSFKICFRQVTHFHVLALQSQASFVTSGPVTGKAWMMIICPKQEAGVDTSGRLAWTAEASCVPNAPPRPSPVCGGLCA